MNVITWFYGLTIWRSVSSLFHSSSKWRPVQVSSSGELDRQFAVGRTTDSINSWYWKGYNTSSSSVSPHTHAHTHALHTHTHTHARTRTHAHAVIPFTACMHIRNCSQRVQPPITGYDALLLPWCCLSNIVGYRFVDALWDTHGLA
jgi:hypothetical protein